MNKLNITFALIALCCLAIQVSARAHHGNREKRELNDEVAEFENAVEKSGEDFYPVAETSMELMQVEESMDEKAVGGKRKKPVRKGAKKAKKSQKGKRKSAKKPKRAQKPKKTAAKKTRGGKRKAAARKPNKGGKKGGKRRN